MELLRTPARRRLLFALLYLSEGAPIGLLWWALPVWLREGGAPLSRITLLASLLALPWSAKMLWAPLVDVLRTPRFGLRGWLAAAQCGMLVTLAPLLWLDLAGNLPILVPLLVLHALAAATPDVAIDAMAIASTPPSERGRLTGWMQAGMLAGRAVFGGGALLAAAWIGIRGVVALLLVTVAAVLSLVLLARPRETGGAPQAGPPGAPAAPASAPPADREGAAPEGFARRLRAAFSRPSTWAGLAFALVGGAGFEAVGVVASPFLLDHGASRDQVGLFFALPVVGCLVAGSLAGGRLADGWGARRATALSGAVVAALVLALAGAAAAAAGTGGLVVLLSLLYLGIGLFTASSYALFMNLTDPRLGATQFSAFMGATNLCEAWAALAVGRLAAGQGYAGAFLALGLVSLASLPLLAAISVRSRPERLAR